MPLYRQEKEFERYGVNITRGEMARWTILCAERYLSVFYDYLHQKIYEYHVLQADETPVRVTKENRTVGDKHYMWVYRTGTLAYLALRQIQDIYREENKLRDMNPEERQIHRQLTVKPLVDVYFSWVKQNVNKVTAKSKTHNG